jgi:hypothetical protein
MKTKEKYCTVLNYLSKNYTIKDGSFWDIHDPHKEPYDYIINSLAIIFSFNKGLCKLCLKMWSLKEGLSYEEWAKLSSTLKFTWSPVLVQDVSAFHNIYAEAELTALLSHEIAQEIDREIDRDL